MPQINQPRNQTQNKHDQTSQLQQTHNDATTGSLDNYSGSSLISRLVGCLMACLQRNVNMCQLRGEKPA